jgi:hypothetical protein
MDGSYEPPRAFNSNNAKEIAATMKVKEFVALEKRLLPTFPGFAVKGQLMILSPIKHTLIGFHFDGSSFDKDSFYANAFFMPLCIPTDHIHLTFGQRVRNNKGERWNTGDLNFEAALEAAMQKEAPFLRKLRTPRDVAAALKPMTRPNGAGYVNPHCYEAFAYSLLQAGETTTAAEGLDTLIKRADPTVKWESEIASRARLIRDKLLDSPKIAHEQLALWQNESIRNLKIDL